MIEKDKDNWVGHKEVSDLVSRIPELREIQQRFAKVEKEVTDYQQEQAFDDILWSFVYYRHELITQLAERPFSGITVKEDVYSYAKKYLDSKFMHNSFLTNSIVLQIIDTELAPMECEIKGITHPGFSNLEERKISNIFSYPWNKLISLCLSLMFLVVGIYLVVFLSSRLSWLAWVIGIILMWHYTSKFISFLNSVKSKNKLSVLAANLRVIREEITNHSYDARVISDRIKKLEFNGLYVHSLIYPLLELESRI